MIPLEGVQHGGVEWCRNWSGADVDFKTEATDR
jgi:hypothetical protein